MRQLLGVAGLALVSVLAQAGFAAAADGCSNAALHQAASGRVSGCMQVGSLTPGRYSVSLQESLIDAPPRAHTQKAPGPVKGEPAAALSVHPAAGAPGALVTVTGTVAAAIPHDSQSVEFCWDGCSYGLEYQSAKLRWSGPRRFTVRLRVPDAPWVVQHPVAIAGIRTGTYPISVQCLRFASGCAVGAAEVQAQFTRVVTRAPNWCRTAAGCGSLTIAPGSAQPGEYLRVSGDTPLVGFVGNPYFPGEAVVRRAAPNRPFVKLTNATASFGAAALRLRAPVSWASLGTVTALATTAAGVAPIAADPSNQNDVAWCGTGTIGRSAGPAATTVSTASAATRLKQLGYDPLQSAAACSSVIPAGPNLIAAFDAGIGKYGAPPVYDVPLISSDGGSSWSPLPVPAGTSLAGFGGLRTVGDVITAVFSARAGGHGAAPEFDQNKVVTETSTDDGATWSAGALGCPAAGPCLTIQPYLWGNCAMNGTFQAVLRAGAAPPLTEDNPLGGQLNACLQSELVATGPLSALAIDPTSAYPVSQTTDAGASWHDVGIPAISGAGYLAPSYEDGGLLLLPDGALLRTGENTSWKLLAPAAKRWCTPSGVSATLQRQPQAGQLTVIGQTLWWLTYPASASAKQVETVHTVRLSSVSCGS